MTDYKKLIEMLRYCASDDPVCERDNECPYYDHKEEEETHWYHCSERMMIDAANAIEELYKAARSMHTWIFLNAVDEQEAYDECKLTDEMNAILGYTGKFVLKKKDKK